MTAYRSHSRRSLAALRTCETDSSLLPTLTVCQRDNRGGGSGRVGPNRPSLKTLARGGLLPTLTVHGNYNRKGASSESGDGLRTALLPTLLSSSAHQSSETFPRGNLTLKGALLPTLTASLASRGGARESELRRNTPSLDAQLRTLLPTLTTRDEKGPGPAQKTKGGKDLPHTLGGHLNPEWCRWFMGFPAGWLDVDDAHAFARSATPSSRSARKSSAG